MQRLRTVAAHVRPIAPPHRCQTRTPRVLCSSSAGAHASVCTTVFLHDSFGKHNPGSGHPEQPDRYSQTRDSLFRRFDDSESSGIHRVRWECSPPRATHEQLSRVHSESYLTTLYARLARAANTPGGVQRFDTDTVASEHTEEAVRRAAGAACAAVDAVASGNAKNAFCLVRPPGHHAEPGQAMGFCFVNSVMVAAAHALATTPNKIRRVAVYDFDVHHGNGSATMAAEREAGDILYLSTHQHPLYPGTGDAAALETSSGNVVNVPLDGGSGSTEFRTAVETQILPAIRGFEPDLLIISAGFDAHAADPLAGLELTDEDYEWVTEQLLAVATDVAKGRVVSVLEGGCK